MWVVNATLRLFYPRERLGTHCIVVWVSSRTGMDGCGKCRPPPGLDPRTVQHLASRYNDWAIAAHIVLFLARQPPVGHGFLILEVSKSHTTMHHSRYDSSGRVISPSQRPLPYNTQNTHKKQTSMLPVGFEPTISAGERPQTYALDRAGHWDWRPIL